MFGRSRGPRGRCRVYAPSRAARRACARALTRTRRSTGVCRHVWAARAWNRRKVDLVTAFCAEGAAQFERKRATRSKVARRMAATRRGAVRPGGGRVGPRRRVAEGGRGGDLRRCGGTRGPGGGARRPFAPVRWDARAEGGCGGDSCVRRATRESAGYMDVQVRSKGVWSSAEAVGEASSQVSAVHFSRAARLVEQGRDARAERPSARGGVLDAARERPVSRERAGRGRQRAARGSPSAPRRLVLFLCQEERGKGGAFGRFRARGLWRGEEQTHRKRLLGRKACGCECTGAGGGASGTSVARSSLVALPRRGRKRKVERNVTIADRFGRKRGETKGAEGGKRESGRWQRHKASERQRGDLRGTWEEPHGSET